MEESIDTIFKSVYLKDLLNQYPYAFLKSLPAFKNKTDKQVISEFHKIYHSICGNNKSFSYYDFLNCDTKKYLQIFNIGEKTIEAIEQLKNIDVDVIKKIYQQKLQTKYLGGNNFLYLVDFFIKTITSENPIIIIDKKQFANNICFKAYNLYKENKSKKQICDCLNISQYDFSKLIIIFRKQMETLCTTKKSLEEYVERFDFNTIMYISYNQIEYFLGKDIRTIFEYIEYFSGGKVGYFYYFDKYMAYQFYKKNGYNYCRTFIEKKVLLSDDKQQLIEYCEQNRLKDRAFEKTLNYSFNDIIDSINMVLNNDTKINVNNSTMCIKNGWDIFNTFINNAFSYTYMENKFNMSIENINMLYLNIKKIQIKKVFNSLNNLYKIILLLTPKTIIHKDSCCLCIPKEYFKSILGTDLLRIIEYFQTNCLYPFWEFNNNNSSYIKINFINSIFRNDIRYYKKLISVQLNILDEIVKYVNDKFIHNDNISKKNYIRYVYLYNLFEYNKNYMQTKKLTTFQGMEEVIDNTYEYLKNRFFYKDYSMTNNFKKLILSEKVKKEFIQIFNQQLVSIDVKYHMCIELIIAINKLIFESKFMVNLKKYNKYFEIAASFLFGSLQLVIR